MLTTVSFLKKKKKNSSEVNVKVVSIWKILVVDLEKDMATHSSTLAENSTDGGAW